MSRRIFQVLQRALRTSRLAPLRATSPRQLLLRPYNTPPTVLTTRQYATEAPRVPVRNEEDELQLTESEKERNALHQQAQYSNPQTSLTLFRKEIEANNAEKAISIYETLLARDDLNRFEKRLAYFNLGVIHHRDGKEAEGLALWKDAVSLPMGGETDPLLEAEEKQLAAAACMNLGAHYALAREVETGIKFLESAAELDPEDGEIRFNLGATLASIGKREEAIKEFEEAEKLGIEIAREMIQKLELGIGPEEPIPDKDKNTPK